MALNVDHQYLNQQQLMAAKNTLQASSNEELAKGIRRSLPRNCYTSIFVRTINYTFRLERAQTASRCITLDVSCGQQIAHIARALLRGVLYSDPALALEIDQDIVTQELFRAMFANQRQATHLNACFKQNRKVDFIISQDLSKFDIVIADIGENTFAQTIHHITSTARGVLLAALPFLLLMGGGNQGGGNPA